MSVTCGQCSWHQKPFRHHDGFLCQISRTVHCAKQCGKGKVDHAPQESIGGCSSPSSRPWARRWRTANVCDVWPVRRQTYGHLPSRKASPPIDLTWLMAIATKMMSTHGAHGVDTSPLWCLLSMALLQWSLYSCQHSHHEYCLTISFLVGRLVKCHELCRVEERMDIYQGPFVIHVQNTITVIAVTLLLYHSLYSNPSLHPYYVFGHALLGHRFLEA